MKTFRLVSYNVGAFTKWGGNSYALVAGILSDLEPDFVALQEVDNGTLRTKGVNQAEKVCDALNALPCTDPSRPWRWAFGEAMPYQDGSYGNAVLYRGRSLFVRRVAIPQGLGSEPRCCVAVETSEAVFASVHLDYRSIDAALDGARLVTEKLSKWFRKSGKPVFLCGDFNMEPNSATIRYMHRKWILLSEENGLSYPCRKDAEAGKCIDYVWMLKNGAGILDRSSEVADDIPWRSVREASDHYPICASVCVG